VVFALLSASAAQAAEVRHTNFKRFYLGDLVADFEGRTYGPAGNGQYQNVLCSLSGAVGSICDPDHAPIPGNDATLLYPIDSEFGFNVVPYALATQKTLDGIYAEGYAGNIVEAGKVVGLELSDAATDTFQVPAGLGTWCSGIGGSSVKCSTEAFVVMEHVLTCHETMAYIPGNPLFTLRADPEDGTQAVLNYVEDGVPGSLDCDTAQLDHNLTIHTTLVPSVDGMKINDVDWVSLGLEPSVVLDYLPPNESTVLTDIAVGADYSITAKDDGKPLYRWGNLIKRPNDIRLYKRMQLPAAWKNGSCDGLNTDPVTMADLGCRVNRALLVLNHKITNNPNDQVRAEDMENEGAIGRLPGRTVDATYGAGAWISDTECYEGDGDYIPAGVVLRNTHLADTSSLDSRVAADDDYVNANLYPYGWSSDLRKGNTNAWYTTVDREPFEWSYDTNGDGFDDVSTRAPLDLSLPAYAGYELLSGPRWRLTPGKFGQNLPALDIPNVNCAPPPYVKALIKYDVGVDTQTKLDMLDFGSSDERFVTDPVSMEHVSPLAFSNGWVDGTMNDGTVLNPDYDEPSELTNPNLTAVTVNGAPVSQDFDLSIYVKGDKKPTALYSAYLLIEYEDGTP
jgi:hypothetical protein